ncbi:nuclear transport factor 2 family protein [Croceicoccus mobilis]|uniref:SnoaL-like domain-containing protein n=1 Tax=Croceicoccus mobilis TaxID=1703339 RepID=A0A916Z938_9SPHN|nr:nuclear transport factor 2 family protein [Croceicoccus mobilis]GGD80581.1 hypothetical protein GCM10010990_33080 [Croceicoccus mobilis]
MDKSREQFAEELADREAIRDCLYRYCRAIDRLDEDLLRSVYWPGAIDEHVGFEGTGEEFVEHVVAALGPLDQTMHNLGNILIDVDGADARGESYFHAFHRIPREDGSRWDLIVAGRYLDRFERRGGVWKIGHRVVILDWLREYPDSADWSQLPFGMQAVPGSRKPGDRSYELLVR